MQFRFHEQCRVTFQRSGRLQHTVLARLISAHFWLNLTIFPVFFQLVGLYGNWAVVMLHLLGEEVP